MSPTTPTPAPTVVPVDIDTEFTVSIPKGPVGRLSFSAKVAAFDRIFVLDLDRRRVTPLVSTVGNNTAGVWSPDGERLVFVSDRDGNKELYSIRWDGSDEVRLTDTPEVNEDQPAWHPSGRELVYVAETPFQPGKVAELSGPADNRDGSSLFALTVATGAVRRLSRFENRNINPRWSPAGDRIALATNRFWPGWRISLFNPVAHTEEFFSKASGRVVSQPAWSPNGDRLFFADNTAKSNAIGMFKFNDKSEASISNGPGRHLDPTPSPDNKWLAFTYAPPQSVNFNVFIINRMDKSIKALLSSVHSLRHLSWSGVRSISLEAEKVKAADSAQAATEELPVSPPVSGL